MSWTGSKANNIFGFICLTRITSLLHSYVWSLHPLLTTHSNRVTIIPYYIIAIIKTVTTIPYYSTLLLLSKHPQYTFTLLLTLVHSIYIFLTDTGLTLQSFKYISYSCILQIQILSLQTWSSSWSVNTIAFSPQTKAIEQRTHWR